MSPLTREIISRSAMLVSAAVLFLGAYKLVRVVEYIQDHPAIAPESRQSYERDNSNDGTELPGAIAIVLIFPAAILLFAGLMPMRIIERFLRPPTMKLHENPDADEIRRSWRW